ncbi:prolactin receptor [Oryzias latipes]|uniref:prolactin receptor n=1 Tax=Oryzias latipes TaxID=8090 RepID=UPI0002A4958B|nr:prolactin receptor [Oryzias latipes]
MKRIWPLPVPFTSFLLSLASQSVSAENYGDVCEDYLSDHVHLMNSNGGTEAIENKDVEHTFTCLLYQTDVLNCSWSFHTSEKDMGMSVFIGVCKDQELVDSKRQNSVERTGSLSWEIDRENVQYVTLRFNTSLLDKWTTYTLSFEKLSLIVLPSPSVSALIKDGDLKISWEIPGRDEIKASWYDLQLDMGDQGNVKNLTEKLSYTEPNVDPSITYRLRMRTKISELYAWNSQWSEWSPIFTLEKTNPLNPLVILGILLVIPMILLAVLLLVRHQRLSNFLFPPIPRPPQKYQYFLEKIDPLSFSCPAPPASQEEEITEVEDTVQSSDDKK